MTLTTAAVLCTSEFNRSYLTNVRATVAGLAMLVFGVLPLFIALQASAQVETEVETKSVNQAEEQSAAQDDTVANNNGANADADAAASINLSPEDIVTLSGYRQYQELRDELAKAGKRESVYLTMPNDEGGLQRFSASEDFKARLKNKDPAGLLEVLRIWDLEFKYPLGGREVNLGVTEEATPENLLFRAAMVNYMALARDLLSNYTVDVNSVNEAQLRNVSALIPAVAGQHTEMVELLLEAGADPNLKPGNGSRPLKLAIENKDTRSTRALFEAGASLEEAFVRQGLDPKVFNELIQDDNVELVSLLLENGHDPSPEDYFGRAFTPLMSALLKGRSQMALALLQYSDPSPVTKWPVTREQSGVDDIAVLPPGNALFVAQLRRFQLAPNIIPAIEQRIATLGGQEAVLSSRIQAAISMSDFTYLEGNPAKSYKILDDALNSLSVATIKNASNADLVTVVKMLLAKKHELDIVNETTVSARDQEFINELTGLGEPMDHWHAMLNTIKQAQTGDYDPQLDQWRQQYTGRTTSGWDYSRLNNWIRSLDNEADQKRLYRALDYFEFFVSVSK